MKLYWITQNTHCGYDTYDSAVVAAPSAKAACLIHPGGYLDWDGKEKGMFGVWSNAADVEAEYIGKAKPGTKAGVICASFNAG